MATRSTSRKKAKTKKPKPKASRKRNSQDALSERVVAIPEVAVFSELPFARVGTIGGRDSGLVSTQSELVQESFKSDRASKTLGPTVKKSKRAGNKAK